MNNKMNYGRVWMQQSTKFSPCVSVVKFTTILKLSSITVCTCVSECIADLQNVHIYLISLLAHQQAVKCVHYFECFIFYYEKLPFSF